MRQNLRSLVPKERIQLFAPDEERMYLLNPPFHTVAELMAHNKFWSRFAAIEDISPELSINVGDFGPDQTRQSCLTTARTGPTHL
jgi:hypothetical protein